MLCRPASPSHCSERVTSAVRIGRREIGFCEVGPLTSETDITFPEEPYDRFETVVLRRALTRSQELYEWRRGIVEGKRDHVMAP